MVISVNRICFFLFCSSIYFKNKKSYFRVYVYGIPYIIYRMHTYNCCFCSIYFSIRSEFLVVLCNIRAYCVHFLRIFLGVEWFINFYFIIVVIWNVLGPKSSFVVSVNALLIALRFSSWYLFLNEPYWFDDFICFMGS